MKRMTPEDLRKSIELAHSQMRNTGTAQASFKDAVVHLADLREIERQWAENSAESLIKYEEK